MGDRAKTGTLVLDLDGVLYVDTLGVPGAASALTDLQEAGYRLLFVTNNATKTEEDVVRHLEQRIGFRADAGSVITSAAVTARHLAGTVATVFVLGEASLAETLRRHGFAVTETWREAEAVVVGLDRDLTYRKLAAASLAVQAGARLVATNIDSTYPTPEGLLPGGGAITAALSAATGVAPEVCGKPEEPMRRVVRAQVGEGPVWVVGDRVGTDLAMAVAEGWTSVLVLTGVDTAASAAAVGFTPDLIVESVADLPSVLA